jgi:hypothetical protein
MKSHWKTSSSTILIFLRIVFQDSDYGRMDFHSRLSIQQIDVMLLIEDVAVRVGLLQFRCTILTTINHTTVLT